MQGRKERKECRKEGIFFLIIGIKMKEGRKTWKEGRASEKEEGRRIFKLLELKGKKTSREAEVDTFSFLPMQVVGVQTPAPSKMFGCWLLMPKGSSHLEYCLNIFLTEVLLSLCRTRPRDERSKENVSLN